jgi:FMN reductase
MRIAVVVGNPKAGSRTLRVALALARHLQGTSTMGPEPLVVDLADHSAELFDVDSSTIKGLLDSVAGSDVVVVASPTYKATYTGLLKAFLDRYPNDALAQTVCIPVMTGAAPIHALAPEVHLRPLLVELGASTPTRGLFVTEQQFDELDAVIEAWVAAARPRVDAALRSATSRLGPAPDPPQARGVGYSR